MAFIGPVIVLLAVGFALLGVVMIVRGLRGRRVGNTPHCRRCDYVVDEALLAAAFGRGAAASPKCPECGAVLRAGDAIRQGERRRRPMLAVAGLVLLLVGVPVVMAGAGGFLSSTAITKHAPTGLLLWQVRQGTQRMVDGGLAELVARNINLKLSTAEQREVLDTLIERFERPSNGWTAQCQEAFSTFEDAAGPLTDVEMVRLARGVKIEATIRHRDRVQRGKQMQIVVELTLARPPPKEMMVRCHTSSVRVGGKSLTASNVGYTGFQIDAQQLNRRIMPDLALSTLMDAPTGKHPAEIDVDLVVATTMSQEELDRVVVSHAREVEIVEATIPVVEELTKPDAREMRQIIKVPRLDVHSWPKRHGGVTVIPTISSAQEAGKGRPTCFFDVFVVPDPVINPRAEFRVATFRDSGFATIDMGPTADTDLLGTLRGKSSVRVILRSDANRAAAQTLHTSIWKGELIYDDVPVSFYENGMLQGN
jgi:predicted RNA-binding Zn-ribbon protein involved in translation (DUF1610 family)